MRILEESEIREFLRKRFADSVVATDDEAESWPDDYDLMLEGVIDSFGVLEMVGAVEELLEGPLDLEELDPELITKVGPFARFVASFSRGEVRR